MEYPKIYLAIDNCFASKRWTQPAHWMKIIKKLGLTYCEASADNECDPLYMGTQYLEDWVHDVKACSELYGIKVANLYSGHGTYATLGLSHTDERVRQRFLKDWLVPMASTAGKLKAGLGFYCHAFPDSALQDPEQYYKIETVLYDNLAELAAYATQNGFGPVGVEQMYTPHQIPWTIDGARKLLKEVFSRSNSPFYLTIDVGHQTGQRKFMRPYRGEITELLRDMKTGKKHDGVWVGPEKAYEILDSANMNCNVAAVRLDEMDTLMDRYPYLFASYEDGDPYAWLEKLGCYSPIIHLQQTTGKSSSHLPFTAEENSKGIISGEKVLRALMCAYERVPDSYMPPMCSSIYLTLEVFTRTADINNDLIGKLKDSVAYWRQFIPKDGMRLDELVERSVAPERYELTSD